MAASAGSTNDIVVQKCLKGVLFEGFLSFQENSVKLSNRVFSLITETFVDHLGIDYEVLHRSMMRAQLLTSKLSI